MEKIIWFFGVIAVQSAQGLFPSVMEVKSRTRWCLGEGTHCPVNLLVFSFSSCCKPYVCTAIPKTRKPTLLLRFSNYTDHRCLLPASHIESVTSTQENEASEAQLEQRENENTKRDVIPEDNEIFEVTTIQLDTNENVANVSNLKSDYEDNYESIFTASNETYSLSNETSHSVIKRSISNIYSESNEENGSEQLTEAKDYNNASSSEESEILSSTNHNLSSASLSSPESDKSSFSSEISVFNSSEYSFDNNVPESQQNSTNNNLDKLYELSLNETWLKNDSLVSDSYFENVTSLHSMLLTNSSDVTEEEWTSSDMTYDTRPGLHRVVTVLPFRLFQSVELIKLNESIETSD